ncbi:MAG: transposase family protein, partial [Proteobacteria bacterium]|nr:transposase family protein [Pseudomonadota bacterium]
MSITKFIERLLKMQVFSVRSLRFENWYRELWLEVKPKKNGALCPHCRKRGRIVHTLEEPRVWRDVPVCGRKVFFHYRPREIDCRIHGRVQEDIPWAAPNARVTYRFEYSLLIHCTIMTQKAAARLLKIADSTMSDLLHRIVGRERAGHRIRKLKMI